MDRRTYSFVVASAAFLFFYLSLRAMFVPQQPPAAPQEIAQVAEEDGQADEGEPDNANDASDPEADAESEAPVDGVATTKVNAQWFTLGSMNPEDGFNQLITFTNQGAGIARIELTDRQENGKFSYRRVDTRSGYLGYFAPTPAKTVDGIVVNVVGPGTPAISAVSESGEKGIQVGDVILAVAGTPIENEKDLEESLEQTRPGQTVTVEVARGDDPGAAATPLLFEATLSEHPLDLVRLAVDGGDDQVKGNLSRLSCLMTLAKAGRKSIPAGERYIAAVGDPEQQSWEAKIEQGDDGSQTIKFETVVGTETMEEMGGQPVRLTRSYTITPGSYLVDMDVSVANIGEDSQELSYRLEGANGVTLEGWWYSTKISPNFGGAAARDIVYRTNADGHKLISGMELVKRAQKTPEDADQGIFAEDSSEAAKSLSYIGVDAQYFAAAYLPTEGQSRLDGVGRSTTFVVANADQIHRHKHKAVNVSYSLDSKPVVVAPGQSIGQSLRLYAGPKEPEMLEQNGMSDFICYGWFRLFSRPLSWLLHLLQSMVGNYGIAIILLTVIVRGCMFPLSRNAAINAQRMQELAPEMKKIAEKYKDDMEKRLRAQQELQKKVGFNPLSGCLPMFLQLPIFMGLYRALSVDIDLRQKPFFSSNGWASNLAAPDMFMYWEDWMPAYFSERGAGWLGPYLNVFPLIVVVLFLTQQKLFMPPPTDEQQAMTQKVMTFMTLFMGLFFFRVPAGLCIYFVASSLWGIAERLLVKKTLPSGKHFDLGEGDVVDAVSATPTESDKPQSFAERLVQKVQQKEPEPPTERPNKRRRPPTGKAGKKKR